MDTGAQTLTVERSAAAGAVPPSWRQQRKPAVVDSFELQPNSHSIDTWVQVGVGGVW